MRKNLYILTFLLLSLISFAQPLAKYNFDNNMTDWTGNGYTGVPTGCSYTSDRNGKINSALLFNGSSDFVDIGTPSLGLSDLTFSFWAKRNLIDATWHVVMAQGINATDQGLHVVFSGTSGHQELGLEFMNDGLYDSTGADASSWTHWALTYSYSGGVTNIYRNGSLVKSGTLGSYTGSGNFFIGKDPWSGDFFGGSLDDISIWTQTLSALQIDSIYQAEKPSGLLAWYDFNGNGNDISGNNNHGTPSNASLAADRNGNPGTAYYFDGATSSVGCPALDLTGRSLSMGFWTQRSTMDGNWHAVITQGTSAAVDQSLHVGLTGTIAAGEQDLGFDFWGDGVYDTTGAKSTAWNHWFFTYDYSNYNIKMYRNGQLIKASTLTGAYIGSGNVNIGFSQWAGNYFEGNIDEVLIYTSLLSGAQVDSIYQSQKPVCTSFGLSSNIVDVNCHGSPDGMVTVYASSGVTPFTFSWSNAQTFNPATSLAAGNYTCVVTDAVGCKDSVAMFVNEPATWNVVMSYTPTLCNGSSDGSAEALAAGGTPPYTYSWAPLNEFNPVITGYPAGSYYCNVTDSHGCQHLDSINITEPAPMTATATASSLTICQGQPDTLSATYTGGTGPYTFTWYDYGTSTTYTTTSDSIVLEPISTPSVVIGLTVYDFYGCYAYSSASLNINKGDSLSGFAIEPNSSPVYPGTAYLIKQKLSHVGLGDTAAIMPLNAVTGSFMTPNLYWGDYRLKVVADTTSYPTAVGTYYGTSPNAYQWDSAVVIQHHGCAGGNNSGKNVTIIEIVPTPGPCDISGTVYSIPGFGNRVGPGGFAPQGAPLKGVDIKLGKNPGGSPAARTTTDNAGHYDFPNVAAGSYKIYVDIPNYGMDSARTVDVSATDTISVKNDYYVDSALVHVVPYYNISVVASICNGDSIFAGGNYQHATGIYVDSLLAVMGGDSVITTDLTNNPLPLVTANTSADTVCAGNNVTLTGGGASTYMWSTGVTDGVAFAPGATDTYTVTGTDSNGCQDTATVKVVVQVCIGINSYSNVAKVTVYPNPATDKLIVTCSGIPQSIQVQNISGETVLDGTVNGNRSYLDVSKIAAGVYFVKVILQNNESKFIKVVKN